MFLKPYIKLTSNVDTDIIMSRSGSVHTIITSIKPDVNKTKPDLFHFKFLSVAKNYLLFFVPSTGVFDKVC
jgi:hypothetical protein